ncbi:MAG: ribosome biogenesis GTP-binding protein YsxC [Bacteriovoracaceae bacterium]|nr:ribosome biogenesis GTP-binding protein YsxC [Bacteriovoracaceae bacterium]
MLKKSPLSTIHFIHATFERGFVQIEDVEAWLGKQPQALFFCFAGRSNVGKSSLINRIFEKSLARTSNTPGRTKEINLFKFELQKKEPTDQSPLLYFFDLPGYGYADVSKAEAKHWQYFLPAFFELLPAQTHVILIQDARHPDQKSDELFLDFIKSFDLEKILVFNKIDKIKSQKEKNAFQKTMLGISKKYKIMREFYQVSAEKKTGVEELKSAMLQFIERNKGTL